MNAVDGLTARQIENSRSYSTGTHCVCGSKGPGTETGQQLERKQEVSTQV